MKNDLSKTFGEIFDGDISAFRKQLLEIQHIQADRQKAEEWVSNLRFLDISKVPNLEVEKKKQDRRFALAQIRDPLHDRVVPSREIPVTQPEDDDGKTPYIAVSWKWTEIKREALYEDPNSPVFDYRIKRPGAKSHKSSFPDSYMDRVIRFAQSINVSKLWIDKECIYQRPGDERMWPEDKQHGVQIMDVVYGDSNCSVGLLTVDLAHQQDIDLLSKLLQGHLFIDPKNKDSPKLRPEVNIKAVQTLILRILSDPRWSRGWIFQEDHLASDRMVLLIPYPKHGRVNYDYEFGDITGELQINLKDLRQNVTLFCLACPEERQRQPNTDIIGKLKQYNIWNRIFISPKDKYPLRSRSGSNDSRTDGSEIKRQNIEFRTPAFLNTTNSVLDDICTRSLENEEDRIAILANALRFTKRINISEGSTIHEPGKYSLSVALLALILMNGEILTSRPWEQYDSMYLPSESNLMRYTLRSYLTACRHPFIVPNMKLQQRFVDRCRLKSPKITSRGIETKGYLFDLFPHEQLEGQAKQHSTLCLTEADRDALPDLGQGPVFRGRKLDKNAHIALDLVIRRLEEQWPGSKLANYMRRHLVLDQHPPRPKDVRPSTPYVLDMMLALYQALLEKRELRFARLVSAPQDTEPAAIFIKPEPNGWKTEHALDMNPDGEPMLAKVFTSWDKGRNFYDKERLASLEIGVTSDLEHQGDGQERGCFLYSYGWVNGVWYAEGDAMETFVFPLAGITEQKQPTDRSSSNGERKRKRGIDT
ncbi:unnamed protein product [Alternaria alternata]